MNKPLDFTPDQLQVIMENLHKLPLKEQAETLELLEEFAARQQANNAKTSLLAFAHLVAPVLQIETEPKVFMVGPHHKRLAALMDAVARGEKKRILISVAPRMGKSLMSSYLFPAWYMGQFPNRRIIMASNTADMANGFGRKVRDLIDTPEYRSVFPDVELKADSKAAGQWATNKGGEFYAVGVGGALAGRGANCVYFSCKCLTKRGTIPISQVRVGDQIWGYDHDKQTNCWTTVRAVSTSIKPELIRFGDFICTPEHRVYTPQGYQTARDADRVAVLPLRECFLEGQKRSQQSTAPLWNAKPHQDFLFSSVQPRPITAAEQALFLWQPQSGGRLNMQTMLPKRKTCRSYLRALWYWFSTLARCACEEFTTTWKRSTHLLQQGVLHLLSRSQSSTANRTYGRVQDLWNCNQPQKKVLWAGMLCSTQSEKYRVSGRVEREEARSSNPGPRNMRPLRERTLTTSSTPHKSQSDRSFNAESCITLRTLSQPLSSADFGICADDLTPLLSGQGFRVVDIQTDTHNFYCEEILAHNCVIIDDPFSEKAVIAGNTDVFEDAWTWFQSGPLQRLSPSGACLVIHCIAEGERVLLADGRWLPIEHIRIGDRVASKEGKDSVGSKVTALVPQGEDDILEVTSRSCTLRVNKRHPFLVVKGGVKKAPHDAATRAEAKQWTLEWVTAEKLTPGDTVVTIKQLESGKGHRPDRNKTQGATQDDYWLFGFLLGDGWLIRSGKRGVVGFAIAKSIYPELNARVLAAVKMCFGVDMKDTPHGYWRVDSLLLGKRLLEMGLLHGAKIKRVPDWAFKLRSCDKRAFILGMCEADGCLRKAKRGDPVYTIGISNYELLDDFRLLARTCGVRTTKIYTEHFTAQPPGSPSPVQGTTYRARFAFSYGRIENKARYKYQTSGSGTQHFRFEDIEAITPVGRAPVYDLTVEGTENFIAEGFVVHNTRWSKIDLIGRLIDQMTKNPDTEQWEVVEFPAILNEGTDKEKSLWPERWPLELLLQKKAVMAPYLWNAQYMQSPTGEVGALIKPGWWKNWEKKDPPDCEYVIMSLDAAQESHNRADYNACQVWGVFYDDREKANIILLDAWRKRMEYPELKKRALEYYTEWEPDTFVIEKKSSGSVLFQEFRNAGIPVSEFTPGKGQDKIARVNSVTDMFESGLIWAPLDRRWAQEVVEECNDFPNGAHDDHCDALTLALRRFRTGGFIKLPTDEKDEESGYHGKRVYY